jgi:hypothetical protein
MLYKNILYFYFMDGECKNDNDEIDDLPALICCMCGFVFCKGGYTYEIENTSINLCVCNN